MKQRVFSHLRVRWRVMGLVGLIALLVGLARPAPAQRSRLGLGRLLAHATGQWIDDAQLVWEPSRGTLTDLLLGRGVFFLAAPRQGQPRDVHHALVRVSRSGQPLAVRRAHNLTHTPLGDDTALIGWERHAAFASVTDDGVQAVTVLDGAGLDDADLPAGWGQRWLARLSAYQRTGHPRGFGRSDIVLELPARELRLSIEDDQVLMRQQDGRRDLRFDLARRTLNAADGGAPFAAHLLVHKQAAKSPVLWLVDAGREELGAETVAWAQRVLFGAQDKLKSTAYSLASNENRQLAARPPTAPASSNQIATWPPPPVPSIWASPDAGEGAWSPASPAWLTSGNAPPAFYRTFIRPDRNRPYARLLLLAMDMRQLEFGMQAGYEDPKPLAGPPGSGRLPAGERSRVRAVFNGAFKTSHGSYGMRVEGRTLVPPAPNAASIVITSNGDVGLGTWPETQDVPADVQAFRQNLDPLLDGSLVNPTGRSEWGERLAGDAVLTERTALCLTSAGQLYYAWGKELVADTLARGLQQAGCEYAVHLDMNPKHCGFAFVGFDEGQAEPSRVEVADSGMDINPLRMATYSPKDYFYLLAHEPDPPRHADAVWQPSAGTQPDPTWQAGIYAAKTRLGELEVDLLALERGRVDWRLRAGLREPRLGGQRPHKLELSGDEHAAALLALNLGHATQGSEYGLAFDGGASLPLRGDRATLLVPENGDLRLVLPGQELTLGSRDAAVQLPLLTHAGQINERATSRGSKLARAALCIPTPGRVLVALGQNDSSDVLALALLAQGCSDVVELDRGSHHGAFVHRAGSTQAPSSSYETSVLFALNRPMRSHAFRWRADGAQ